MTYHKTVRITEPTESEPAMTFENVQAVAALYPALIEAYKNSRDRKRGSYHGGKSELAC